MDGGARRGGDDDSGEGGFPSLGGRRYISFFFCVTVPALASVCCACSHTSYMLYVGAFYAVWFLFSLWVTL